MKETIETLRKLKVLEGPLPKFEFQNSPETPHELFLTWLNEAIDVGVSEPHAMTLSTVDSNRYPDARTLILKNIDHKGWYFASSSESKKAIS